MSIADFAAVDVAIAAVVLISAGLGLARGLIREVLALAIWAAALMLSLAFGPAVAELLGLDLAPRLQTGIGFVVVFVVVLIAGAICQRLVGGLVKSTGLSGTDRLLGLLFGAARGGVVVIVGLVVLRPFAEERVWWMDSQLAPPLLAFEADVLELAGVLTGASRGSGRRGRPTNRWSPAPADRAVSGIAETAEVPLPDAETIANLPASAPNPTAGGDEGAN